MVEQDPSEQETSCFIRLRRMKLLAVKSFITYPNPFKILLKKEQLENLMKEFEILKDETIDKMQIILQNLLSFNETTHDDIDMRKVD